MNIKELALQGHLIAQRVMDAFNADQPRDERGRWGAGGPGSGAETLSEHNASAEFHRTVAELQLGSESESHMAAAMAHEAASRSITARVPNTLANREYRTRMMRIAREKSAAANAETIKTENAYRASAIGKADYEKPIR